MCDNKNLRLAHDIKYQESFRSISTPRLNALLHLHLEPINPVIYWGSNDESSSWDWLHAYMLSAFIQIVT